MRRVDTAGCPHFRPSSHPHKALPTVSQGALFATVPIFAPVHIPTRHCLLCPKERCLRRVDTAGCPHFRPSSHPHKALPTVSQGALSATRGHSGLSPSSPPLTSPQGTACCVPRSAVCDAWTQRAVPIFAPASVCRALLGRQNLPILGLPHGILHLLNDIPQPDSGQPLRGRALCDGHGHRYRNTA